jgi:hypothetical protein
MNLKSCPKCHWPRPGFGYERTTDQFFVRCPACGFTGLAAHDRTVAGVLWQTADAPDQQGKLTIPL